MGPSGVKSLTWLESVIVSSRSTAVRMQLLLTEGVLLLFPSWPCTMVRWMSETISCALLTLRSSSEPVPCTGLGREAGDSPGALDANFRRQFNSDSKSLTWRESRRSSMIALCQVGNEQYLPFHFDHAYPQMSLSYHDDRQK